MPWARQDSYLCCLFAGSPQHPSFQIWEVTNSPGFTKDYSEVFINVFNYAVTPLLLISYCSQNLIYGGRFIDLEFKLPFVIGVPCILNLLIHLFREYSLRANIPVFTDNNSLDAKHMKIKKTGFPPSREGLVYIHPGRTQPSFQVVFSSRADHFFSLDQT